MPGFLKNKWVWIGVLLIIVIVAGFLFMQGQGAAKKADAEKAEAELAKARKALIPFARYYHQHGTPNFELLGCNGARLTSAHWRAAIDAAKEGKP